MGLISRRNVLSIGVAASVGAILPSKLTASGRFLSTLVASGDEHSALRASDLLAVVPVSDSAGLASLNQLFPGLSSDSGFQPLLPVSFLVSNVTGKDIRAFSTRWKVTAPSRAYEMTIMHYFHPIGGRKGERPGGGKNDPLFFTGFTGAIPAARARTTRLVTPFFSWRPAAYKNLAKVNWAKLIRRRPGIVLSELAEPRVSVKMIIDAAIMDDCAAVGPHDQHLAAGFCVTRNAEHDQAVSVRKRISAGATQEQVAESLRRDVKGVDFKFQTNSPYDNIYYTVRRRQAAVLLRRLQNAGWDEFLETLEYLRSQPKTRKVILSSQADRS